MFVSRKAYEKVGLYDLAYRFSSDLDMSLKLCLSGCRFEKVDGALASFTSGGAAESHLVRASFESFGIIRRRAGLHKTVRYALMMLRRFVLRGVTAIIRILFGTRAHRWLRRRYYSTWLKEPAVQTKGE